MKKTLICLVTTALLFSSVGPVFAEENKQAIVQQAIEQVQKTDDQYQADKKKVSDVIDQVNQSVVAVIGRNTKYRDQQDREYSKVPTNLQHGSGVVIGEGGKVLTNNHVVDGLEEIYVVTYEGNVYKAELLYTDKDIDLALLKINRTDLKPIQLAKESEIKVGDEVVAIGTPLFFGFRNSASKGIVSGLNRPVEGTYTYLQTDAAINPGNSGGPLVSMKGELVGINTLGYMIYQGMSFSIPVGNINYFLDQYNKFGKIKRCFTGIEFEENWAALLGLPTNQGLKVVTVRKDAVANCSEVQEGDMLDAIDDKSVTSIAQYNEMLKGHLPGDTVILGFTRGDKKFKVSIVLGEQARSDNK